MDRPRISVMFDLDGTLIDSDQDLADAANMARRAFGLPLLDRAEVIRHVGYGLGYLIKNTVPDAYQDRLDEARAHFMAYYGEHLLDNTRPLPLADAILHKLQGRAALVTNKPGAFVQKILSGLGWTDLFGAVIAGDTMKNGARKPSGLPLLEALNRLGTPNSGIMVGDTEADLNAARDAKVPFWCVPWGRAAKDADVILRDLLEVEERLRG